MQLQPNLPYDGEYKIIEQPRQFSVNGIFSIISVRDKATLNKYSDEMDHREILLDIETTNDKDSLYRKIHIQNGEFYTIVKGAALCVNTDLRIFWHLLNRKKVSDNISIQDLCEELEYSVKSHKGNHKTIVESFYRLSNNLVNIAAQRYSASFQLLDYEKNGDIITYRFHKNFLNLMNSKNGLERHSIKILKQLKLGVSKLMYTMLVDNKYNNEGIRIFEYEDLAKTLNLTNKKIGKNKEKIKAALQELKSNHIIGDFKMKLSKITIYNNNFMLNKKAINPNIVKSNNNDSSEIDNVFDMYDDNNMNDCTTR